MLRIEASVLTHMGNVRPSNEDSVSLVRPNAKDVMKSHGVLALVADGMGGHEGGELASKLAAEGVTRSYYRSGASPRKALEDAFRKANQEIFACAAENPTLTGMGTTCVAVAILDDEAWWAWIGDSRLYLLRGGQAYRMSEDHTVVHEMICRGLLTADEAHNHPERSVLARAMGTRESIEVAVGAAPINLAPGDRLLVCSDGLHDLLTDAEIAACARETVVPDSAASLLRVALERGGFDNISMVLLEMQVEAAVVKKPPSITREHVFG